MNRRHKTAAALAVTALGVAALAGCTANASTSRGDAHVVVIGYQSKTINTVTAGTLLRQLGYRGSLVGPCHRASASFRVMRTAQKGLRKRNAPAQAHGA